MEEESGVGNSRVKGGGEGEGGEQDEEGGCRKIKGGKRTERENGGENEKRQRGREKEGRR